MRRFNLGRLALAMVMAIMLASMPAALAETDYDGIWYLENILNNDAEEQPMPDYETYVDITLNSDGTGTLAFTLDTDSSTVSVDWMTFSADNFEGVSFEDDSGTTYLAFINDSGYFCLYDGETMLIFERRSESEPTAEAHTDYGTDRSPCIYCSGTGSETCTYCSGTGKESCFICVGKGYERCISCSGTGEVLDYVGLDVEYVTCPDCGGSGNARCFSCGGTGYEECTFCGGYGHEECIYCGGTGWEY